MCWLAANYDDRLRAHLSSGERPPTYAAYRAFSEGMGLYIAGHNAQAFPLFRNAFEVDSSFTPALLYASICLTNVGQWARADSLLRTVDRRRATLSEYHRAWLDYRRALIAGNHEGALAAIRLAAKAAPESKAAYNYAAEAFQSGHLREALATVDRLPSDRGGRRGLRNHSA